MKDHLIEVKYINGIKLQIPSFAAYTTGSFDRRPPHGVREKKKMTNFLKKSLELSSPLMSDVSVNMIDVGANFGSYSFLTIFNKNLYVEAFEPDNAIANCMEEILKINNIHRVKVNHFGLSDHYRKCAMECTQVLNIGTTHIVDKPGECIFKPLDSLNIQKLDLLKIDVEGHELEVMLGAQETIKRCKPSYIQIEIHKKKSLNGTLNTIKEILIDYKYEIDNVDYIFTLK